MKAASPSPTFDTVLAGIRDRAENIVDLGTKFEKLTLDFLKNDKFYTNRFRQVWLWRDWPRNDGKDTGIDLVAEQYDGEFCAIQCKCYAENNTLDMKAVSTFLAKAGSLKFGHRILVYTGDELTKNAEKVLRDSGTTIITPEHFRQSSIDWSGFPKIRKKKPKKPRPHQKEALEKVLGGLTNHDRGKVIMACGTGKTLTALYIAEKQVGLGGIVLYLVPSISLILQSMREWSENANIRHNYMAVCSDKSTGEDGSITELESPVSTDVKTLRRYTRVLPRDTLNVVFSTYHSIEVVEKALREIPVDLALCDEAHRTTGTEGKSFYTRIHEDANIECKKRLYMTATPRVYSDTIKSQGSRKGKVIYSMDDASRYGPELYKLSFTDAVHKHGILSDFRVKIAIVPADKVDKKFQQSIAGKDGSMPLDERTLLAAVWHGIRYPDDDESKPRLLQRVIAFANRIDRSEMFAGIMKDPNDNDRSFEGVVSEINRIQKTGYGVEVRHIDGKTRALHRRDEMRWLDESHVDPCKCRILSNAKCLSEGVDVPALDGVVFLNPRKSVVDVVQSVGRVMRKAEGKAYGYVILPVAIPAGVEEHEAMKDNKTFKVVWEVLNALRSHDEEFAREINRLELDKRPEVNGPISPRISVSIVGTDNEGEKENMADLFEKVRSKIIEKVGDIDYYDKYGEKLGKTARTIEERIKNRAESDPKSKSEVNSFHKSLQTVINGSITVDDTVRVLAQHMVLSRVFDAMFQKEFTPNNPIAAEFEKMASKMGLREELGVLKEFYKDVDGEVKWIDTRHARQSFIKKIYGNFLTSADEKGADKHGVVYTPVEVVDFIIQSTEYLLRDHFGIGFENRSAKILEPFAGTGTFITRLLESGLIPNDKLYYKYKYDIYANELILLAYYVATINIETTYSSMRKGHKYVPFSGMSYTDTLDMDPQYREDDRHKQEATTFDGRFVKAIKGISKQKGSHLHVIIGNPPYSMEQKSYNDNNQNTKYPIIDGRIKRTYMKNTDSGGKRKLYDSYIRSIRWASDRLGRAGIIAFIPHTDLNYPPKKVHI